MDKKLPLAARTSVWTRGMSLTVIDFLFLLEAITNESFVRDLTIDNTVYY